MHFRAGKTGKISECKKKKSAAWAEFRVTIVSQHLLHIRHVTSNHPMGGGSGTHKCLCTQGLSERAVSAHWAWACPRVNRNIPALRIASWRRRLRKRVRVPHLREHSRSVVIETAIHRTFSFCYHGNCHPWTVELQWDHVTALIWSMVAHTLVR